MYLKMLKGKIHRAIVKQAELNYVGSITVDPVLMQAAGILEYENVQIVDIENGNRFETYTIAGEPGSGMICLNGAAAREVRPEIMSLSWRSSCTDDPAGSRAVLTGSRICRWN